MYETKFHRAADLESAVARLTEAEDAKLLAGGQTLVPTMKQRLAAPSDLIDISGLEALKGISVKDGVIRIGAAQTHADVASHEELRAACPMLADLAGHIGDPAVRHRGTIGGSLANNDPAADYPAAALALGATIITNQREIAAEDFFDGLFATVLEEAEVITAVAFPVPDVAGYAKFPNPASRYAMVGVCAARTGDDVRVAITGAGSDGVFRHAGLEAALAQEWSAQAVDAVDVSEDDLLSDIHASAAYRAHLIKVMTKRALA